MKIKTCIKISALVYIGLTVLMGYLNAKNLPGGTSDIFRLQLAFSKANFLQTFQAWTPAGIAYFSQSLYLDMLYLLAYGTFLTSCLFMFIQRINIVVMLPIGAALCDLVENCFHLALLKNVNPLNTTFIFWASVFALAKWILFVLSIFIVLYYVSTRGLTSSDR